MITPEQLCEHLGSSGDRESPARAYFRGRRRRGRHVEVLELELTRARHLGQQVCPRIQQRAGARSPQVHPLPLATGRRGLHYRELFRVLARAIPVRAAQRPRNGCEPAEIRIITIHEEEGGGGRGEGAIAPARIESLRSP